MEAAAEALAQTLRPVRRAECQVAHQDGPVIIIIGQEALEDKEKLRAPMAALLNGEAEEVVGLVEETQTEEIHVTAEVAAGAADGLRPETCKAAW